MATGMSIGAQELWHFASQTKGGQGVLNHALCQAARIYARPGAQSEALNRKALTAAKALARAYVLGFRGGESWVKLARASAKDKRRAAQLFPPMVLGEVAAAFKSEFARKWKGGDFESILPRKLQKAKTRKASRAAREHIRPDVPSGLVVQTLIFPAKGWTRKEAIAWATRHGFAVPKVHASATSYRIRQLAPGDVKKGTQKTISLGACGVRAVVAKKKR